MTDDATCTCDSNQHAEEPCDRAPGCEFAGDDFEVHYDICCDCFEGDC